MDIVSLFNKRLEDHNARETALVFLKTDGAEEKYSWNDYRHKAIYIAEWLKRSGVKKGDFVAIIPLNLPESFFAILGIIILGAVPVPIHIQLLKEAGLVDLRKIINDCKPKLILANESLRKHLLGTGIDFYVIEKIMMESKILLAGFGRRLTYYSTSYPMVESDKLLIMPYTSGTSGQPKGVMLTHKNVLNRLEAVSTALRITENERVLSYLPLGHIAELIATFFGQIYGGYTVYFTEYSKEIVANSGKLYSNFPLVLQHVKPTIFLAVPRIWMSFRKKIEAQIKNQPKISCMIPQWLKKHIIKKKLGFSQTRVFISAAVKISNEDREFFKNFDILIDDIYGQTETAGPLTLNGLLLGLQVEMSLQKDEIIVCGDCVMTGYYQNVSATEHVFDKNSIQGKIINHTGDTGIGRDGKIFWTGRVGNGFKLADGEYVNPDKIETFEERIKKIDPRINEAIICGANKPYLIALVFSENYLDKNLKEKIRQGFLGIGEGILKIRRFVLIKSTELELTPTMKVKRNAMLKKFASEIDSLYK